MANNFYIVPPRLIVGSLQGNNNVTSLNNFRGDVNIVTEIIEASYIIISL